VANFDVFNGDADGICALHMLRMVTPRDAELVTGIQSTQGYQVSVRAPWSCRTGADELCRQFETGGGREAAAGINRLPEAELARFKALFNSAWGQQA
jgi:hypothetical protein